MGKKLRLDALLVARKLVATRSRAADLVRRRAVRVDGVCVTKPGKPTNFEASLEVEHEAQPYVSRAGLKLAAALDAFAIDVTGRIALDIGASTGGFTDVLLRRGAAHVFALDAGHGQLDDRLA
ncbi:MAG TPA: TlyA family rRNA (cytidine-2'-O)-methyltransferase, partial [Rhizobiales bacterium]|nr:TlyA family rRNA (cytidine-2'-O)-methyltransferase [Hyphomicrobiales bacterium]